MNIFKKLFGIAELKTAEEREEQLLNRKVKDFMKTTGCSENAARNCMFVRKMWAKFGGEKNWRRFYD